MNGNRQRWPALVAALLALAFGAACAAFAWQPTLATFADDSVSYLVMAQVFSPYQPASAPVAAAFAREAFYPPLFPLLLALGGAAHHVAWAHALTALLLAASLPLAWLLGARWLDSRGAALAAVFCLALLPSMWINAKGILSEPLFGLLLVATLLVLDRREGLGGWQAALLFAALALTRTVALPVAAGYAAWALTRRGVALRRRALNAAPALAAFAAYALWVLVRPVDTTDDYARLIAERGQGFLEGPGGLLASLAASLLRQSNAIVEGWAGSLMIFWIEGRPLMFALASAAGLLALGGLALRFARGKADAWMAAAYLATLLAWPFHEQMERFLFPLLPVLVLYAFFAAGEFARALGRRAALAQAPLAALLLALSLPAMAFLHQRAQSPEPAARVTDWYRTPDLNRARLRAQTQLDLFDDMRAIGAQTQPGDRVMWVAPAYVALLAGRQGVMAPDARLAPAEYREAVRGSGADYVFLSRYHPRNTVQDTAWRKGMDALLEGAKVVHTRTQEGGSVVSSLLLRAPK